MNKQVQQLNELNRGMKECFNSKAGKAVLTYLKETYHIYETTFRDGLDAIAYSEGQRTVVLDIMDRMEQKPQEEKDERTS